MTSGPAAFKHKPSAGDDSVSVLVDSGASGYYFDDSGLPPFLCGELMMAGSYICSWILHSALNMETPYKKLYRKDADLSHLKIIGARAFLHIKNPNKLGHASWERMVCGFSETESNSYPIWNPKTRRVVESRNVWAFYASVDSLSLGTIKSWHNSFLKSAWRDHTRCSVQIVKKYI